MTLVDTPRRCKLHDFLHDTFQLDGMNAEVGVYKGGTAKDIANFCPHKQLFLFDTFEGMPEVSGVDLHKKGDFSDTSLESVQEYLKDHSNITYVKGLFPKSIPDYLFYCQFSFVHLDCDLYESVKAGLEFFYPRMVRDGIIVLDDYLEPNCPGAKLALNEFLNDKTESIISICQTQAAIRIL